jgi:hypothetical protein
MVTTGAIAESAKGLPVGSLTKHMLHHLELERDTASIDTTKDELEV